MGQRLVVNLWERCNLLANAYYHWGAYSSNSLEIIAPLIKKVEEIKDLSHKFSVLEAVHLLQETGAEVNPEDLLELKTFYPDFKMKKEEINRNDGLIAISQIQKKNLNDWAEGSIDIQLDLRTFDYSVCITYDDLSELKFLYDFTEPEKIPKIFDSPFGSLDRIPFNRLEELKHLIEEVGKGQGILKMPEEGYVSFAY